jgi:hypothetical protein
MFDQEGDLEPDQATHSVSLDLFKCEASSLKVVWLKHILVIWCADHCMAPWRVERTTRMMTIHFSSDVDMVHFRLSNQWDDLERVRHTN